MVITKDEFRRYEMVRSSGRTNMFMVSNVEAMSGLDRKKILEIMKTYTTLVKKYPGVRN